jgi:hypothetical protein
MTVSRANRFHTNIRIGPNATNGVLIEGGDTARGYGLG